MESTKSVVRILSKYYNGSATGSGFVIKNEPEEVLIVTNDHVVSGNPYSILVWVGEDELVDAEIIFTTPEKDLCVLRVNDPIDMKPLKMSKEEPQHGAAIYVVGYPGAGDILSDTQAHTSESVTITDGIISAIRSFTIEEGGKPVKLLQINAAVNSGNSGGPLFNAKGEVIGVNTYKVNANSQGVFGAVDISELWTLLDKHGIEIPVAAVESDNTVLLAACAAAAVVAVAVILKRRKKHTKTEKAERKAPRKQEKAVTLAAYMTQHPQGLGVGGAVSLLLSAAIQLRNLHNDGKLHLQICPDNILISSDGAALKEPTSQEAGRYNTGFAAPEIYKGAGYGITSDIYSFAAALYYAATGKIPANSLQQEMLEADFAMLGNGVFAEALRKAMASSILDRTQSMQELIYSVAVFNAPVQAKREAIAEPAVTEIKETPVPQVGEPQKKEKAPKKRKKVGIVFALLIAVLLCGTANAYGFTLMPFLRENVMVAEVTDGTAVCTAREMTYSTENDVTVYSFTEQLLDNGYIHYKLEYTAQKGRHIFIFDSPDGERFMYIPCWKTREGMQTLVFDIPAENIAAVDTMTLKFLAPDGAEKDAAWISATPYHFNTSVLALLEGDGERSEEAMRYSEAVAWEADGQLGRAAIAFGKLGDYSDARQRSFELWREVIPQQTISAGFNSTAAVKSDGTVLLAGYADYRQRQCQKWSDIVAVSTTASPQAGHTVGLKSDGTVVAVGANQWEQCNTSSWSDIIAIGTGYLFTVGLKADGTVLYTGYPNNPNMDQTVIQKVSSWTDIVAISISLRDAVLGLKTDGTVVMADNNQSYVEEVVKDWSDIVAISTNGYHVVGLKADGTVIETPTNDDIQSDVSHWSDITAIAAGSDFIIGLKSDGTVVSTGQKIDVSDWSDIAAIYAYGAYAIGVKNDGSMVSAGEVKDSTLIKNWTDIKLPN